MRIERESRLKSILAVATDIEDSGRSRSLPALQASTILKNIDKLLALPHGPNEQCDLDKRGTKLWNLASKLKKDNESTGELVCLVRVFACLLIDYAQQCAQGSIISTLFYSPYWTYAEMPPSIEDDVRVMKSLLRASKHCLGTSLLVQELMGVLNSIKEQLQLPLAERVIERAAVYEEKLATPGKDTTQQLQPEIRHLSKEYYILRITLAWRQERLDLAELWLTKLGASDDVIDSSTAETLADLFFEIGQHQANNMHTTEAMTWLTKAHDMIITQDTEGLSGDASELQVSIMHSMVKALIKEDSEENRSRAWNIIQELDIVHGDRLAVLLLKLDLYGLDHAFSPQDYGSVLEKIVRTVHLTDTNVKTTLHHVHKLRSRSTRIAHTILVSLVTNRLFGAEELGWLEKTLITITWNCTSATDLTDAHEMLKDVYDTVFAEIGKAISQSATHAAQVLLCKRVDTSYNQEIYDVAESWCRLSLHPIFANAGSLNVGKLQRKLMVCALGTANYQKALDAHFEMSDINRKHPSTQYILYKVAMRSGNADLAAQCLEEICAASAKDATLLYACVLEAQRAGDRTQSVASLQRVLEKYDYTAPGGVHLPALLRCTARLLIQGNESAGPNRDAGIDEICKLFEGAATQARISQRSSKHNLFPTAELDWFSRNSYNLAIRACADWEARQTQRLISTSLKFLDLYPSDLGAEVLADLSLRRIFCDYLSASLLIVLARDEDNIEIQLQYYLDVRKVAGDFRKRLPEQMERLKGGAREDLLRKKTSLSAYDFEAAARLKAWDSFEQLIADCQPDCDSSIYGTMADIVLCAEAPAEVTIASLQQIVNITWRLNSNDISQLSRWIRCLFSLALTSAPELAEHLLSQVSTIAAGAKLTPTAYPPEELEYLATTTFNRAVDYYCSSQDEACRRWAAKALEIADLCGDGGALQALLMDKYGRLSWEG